MVKGQRVSELAEIAGAKGLESKNYVPEKNPDKQCEQERKRPKRRNRAPGRLIPGCFFQVGLDPFLITGRNLSRNGFLAHELFRSTVAGLTNHPELLNLTVN